MAFHCVSPRILLAALCLTACPSDPPPDDIEALEESFSGRAFVAVFERVAKSTSDACGCTSLDDWNAGQLLQLEASGLRFDEACALTEIHNLSEAATGCAFIPFPECKLMHGGKRQGEECEVLVDGIDDCEEGLRCMHLEASSDLRRTGVCETVGEFCWADWECETGACVRGRCVEPSTLAGLGEDCGDAFCQPELTCTDETCAARDNACFVTPSAEWAKLEYDQ